MNATNQNQNIPAMPATPIMGTPIKCILKKGETVPTPQDIPRNEGWNNAHIYDEDGILVGTDYKIFKTGTKLTIYHNPIADYIICLCNLYV